MSACQHCGKGQSAGLVGTRVDRYQLGKLLGSGGFGAVYLATHVHTRRLVMVVLQALEALWAAHAKGIVHRDMKPANVFVVRRRDERGLERDFVKLLDFGISKMHGDASTSGLTMTGVAMGTPSYMAPEQFFDARSVDAGADLYSVAAMLYELLSGQVGAGRAWRDVLRRGLLHVRGHRQGRLIG